MTSTGRLPAIWPEARRQGYGQRALAELEGVARQAGVHALHLMVRPDNVSAIALCRRAGFIPSPRLCFTKLL